QQQKAKIFSDEENDSIWLCGVLDIIGVNDIYRKTCQKTNIMSEIIYTFKSKKSVYFFGSRCEGTFIPGDPQIDLDAMECDERMSVIEDIRKANLHRASLLIVTELETPAGYVKLQLVMKGVPCTYMHWPYLRSFIFIDFYKTDRLGRIVLFDLPTLNNVFMFSRSKNKPALKSENSNFDMVNSYRCKSWPHVANEWLSRQRVFGWPTDDTINELKSYGFFVVKKGHELSSEIDLEWRISFSHQERTLMFSLTDVQHKCYVVLKMINRDIIKLDYITSYHWKTCLFYVIEENNKDVWKKKSLFQSVKLCINQMLKWVKSGLCPSYFIPNDNLFAGKLNFRNKIFLENKLEYLLNAGFDCLFLLKSGNVCEYVKSRKSPNSSLLLQENSYTVFQEALSNISSCKIADACRVFNGKILKYYHRANGNIANFIKFLWIMLDHIKRIATITEHSEAETQRALSLLTPHIYTCLASNISSLAIKHPNPQVRNFLLFGSFTYFLKGGLSGRLKFISVLYAIGLYKECEQYLDQLDEEHITNNPSLCVCRIKSNDVTMAVNEILELKMSICIWFLPSELPITHDAMKYEIFKYVGISSTENNTTRLFYDWDVRAVVDSNVYFLFLKSEIKRKLGKLQESEGALCGICRLDCGQNMRHPDVAWNFLAWSASTDQMTDMALQCLQRSWQLMYPWELSSVLITEKKKWKQNQFNSAKIHALVILYHTWFAREPHSKTFCFQCFNGSRKTLLQCSKCKIANFCSLRCFMINMKIHTAICEIVSKHLYV
ncbi:cyclic GMP-AMP synthase, partial [Mytilus galloprovincialis]